MDLKSDVDDLEKKSAKTETALKSYKTDAEKKGKRLMEIELEHSQAESELRIVGANCLEMEERYNTLIEEYALLKNDTEDAKDEYEEQIYRLEQELRDAETEIVVLQQKIKTLNSQL